MFHFNNDLHNIQNSRKQIDRKNELVDKAEADDKKSWWTIVTQYWELVSPM